MGLLEAIILSVIAASTPLLLAAAGELVVERSGVLNLGVEGMMIMGAACGFAGAYLTGSTFLGALFGIAAGAALVGRVRPADARPCGQSGGDRPGADHSRHRPVGPDRRRLRRPKDRAGASISTFRCLTESAVRRPHPVRRRTPSSISRSSLVVGDLVVPLPHARRADPARDRRQPHLGARARLSGAQDPLAGGAVRRRLRRAWRRLPAARLYAVLHSGHDRRPRLDRAGAGGVLVLAAGPAGSAALICSAR